MDPVLNLNYPLFKLYEFWRVNPPTEENAKRRVVIGELYFFVNEGA